MEKSSFFDAEIVNGEYDRVYLSEDYAKYFSSFIGNGVFPNPSSNLKVIAEGGSMKVVVKVGKAWINGYYYENDSDLTLIIDNADGVLNRVDRVVLRLDLAQREISIKVKKGEYSSNSIPQEIERNVDVYELAIADIKINNGALSINNSDITDLRLNTELCGLVHGTVEQIDTTDIFNTYQQYLDEKLNSNEFDEWFNKLKNKLNPYEDVALQLQLQISELNEKMEDSLKTDGSLQENLNADMVDGKHASGDLLTNEKENLVDAINEVFQSASDGKNKVANAITGKGVSASNNDTFEILSNKINQIATDTTATASDVLSGKTVYINGNKANGAMQNVNSDIQGSSNSDAFTNNSIMGVASNSYVGAFDFNVSGYVSNPRIHIANLLPQYIKKGVRIGGENGYITGKYLGLTVGENIISGSYSGSGKSDTNGKCECLLPVSAIGAGWKWAVGILDFKAWGGTYGDLFRSYSRNFVALMVNSAGLTQTMISEETTVKSYSDGSLGYLIDTRVKPDSSSKLHPYEFTFHYNLIS